MVSNLRQLCWIRKDILLALYFHPKEQRDHILQLILQTDNTAISLQNITGIKCPDQAIRLFRSADTQRCFLELTDGQIMQVHYSGTTINHRSTYHLESTDQPQLTHVGSVPTVCHTITSFRAEQNVAGCQNCLIFLGEVHWTRRPV